MRGLLLACFSVMAAGNCAADNRNMPVDKGSYSGWVCDGIDGNKHLYYHTTFHSVNNDNYAVQFEVYEFTSGVRADTPFCSLAADAFNDNFDHTANYNANQCEGRFVHVSVEIRYICTTPGAGSKCQIVMTHEEMGNYDSKNQTTFPSPTFGNTSMVERLA